MILTGPEIIRQRERGAITIAPFDPARVNPNSYDFTLGPDLASYDHTPLDALGENPTTRIMIPPDGFVLEPRHVYLAHTAETLGSATFAPSYATRSSIARLGIFVNLSATLGDIGYIGQWPLHLVAVQPVRIYAGMAIGQMLFWTALDSEKIGLA
jgi:deoxycytidine triphosphate deaminase